MAFSFAPPVEYTIHRNVSTNPFGIPQHNGYTTYTAINPNTVYVNGLPYQHQRNIHVHQQQQFSSTMNPTVAFVSNQTFGLNSGFPHPPVQTFGFNFRY